MLEVCGALIREGLELARGDARHGLRLGFRRRLWRSLDYGMQPSGTGHGRRVALEVLAVRHVMHFWEDRFPGDREPHAVLACVEGLLAGGVSQDEAGKASGALWDRCEGIVSDFDERSAYVGFAASQVAGFALEASLFGLADKSDSASDEDEDPYTWDASLWASFAWAGGAPWEGESNALARLEYWEWWLEEAVPSVLSATGS